MISRQHVTPAVGKGTINSRKKTMISRQHVTPAVGKGTINSYHVP